ncbi:helix-turn-helix transcriptional regulator [Melissococcus plutonius]|nr:helix-turn-helix transcriptional regulator [Melissococcus plutonius]MCV2500427.1 helix-turn-helix transcriptional regulator [Melissococcus plutonius]MCV2504531.1 helix-turn-helix transcriptional regulator [Melissococcus plutonius]MCV2519537.1 helix-turn-helix transcriptional regulator [Melissococcus plutonius]MCV2526460.1 helix-turn-helix transcriptional regulator [Melissococcus plutonius]
MKRMTQQELANRVGVSRQTIIQLERNKYNPSLLLAHDIADVFGVTIEDIFTFKKLTDNENSTEQMNDSKEN